MSLIQNIKDLVNKKGTWSKKSEIPTVEIALSKICEQFY